MSLAPRKFVVALVVSALILAAPICEAKRALGGSNRKSSGGGYTTRRQPTSVTKPTYNTQSSSSNSHPDPVKLSYPSSNAQPSHPVNNAPTSNNQPIGWNVPGHNQGPPPGYTPANVAGGAKTNIHEPPPVYQKPNYAAPPPAGGQYPPSYNQATGTNYGAPTYHNPNNLPPGATVYNNPSQIPGGYPMGGAGGYPSHGAYPQHGSYPQQSGYPAAGGYPGNYYQSPQNLPQGATFVQPGSALPPGAVLLSSPPQQSSSGLGFGKFFFIVS